MLTELEIRNALAQVQDPELGRSIVELEMVRDLRIADGKVSFTLALTNLSCPFKDRMVGSAKKAVETLEGVAGVNVYLEEMTASQKSALMKEDAPKLQKQGS